MSRLDLAILPLVGGYIFFRVTFNNTANTHIRILPSLTGHREKTEGKVVSTGWIEIVEGASAAGPTSTLDNPLGVITPVSELFLFPDSTTKFSADLIL